MQDDLNDYISAHISPEPALLTETYRHTNLYHLYPRMCSGHVQGRFLKMLTTMIAPRRVLEIGTFTGYATLCLAEGMPEDGELHTLEIDDELEDELLDRFGRSDYADRISLHIGDALELIEPVSRGREWDLVLIDANKRLYCDYFRRVWPHVRRGGYVLADNTLWDGKVIERPVPADAQTRGIMAFNDMAAALPDAELTILPLRDGLTIIRKL